MLRAGRISALDGSAAVAITAGGSRASWVSEGVYGARPARPSRGRGAGRTIGQALLIFALAVATISGAGFMYLVVHLSPLDDAIHFGSAELGTLFARQPQCASSGASPGAAASALCAAGAPATGVPYSHSWYITDPEHIADLATLDAKWLNAQSVGATCGRDFMTVLDFAHPTRAAQGNASPLDDYAMSLFRHPGPATYRDVEHIAQRYLDAWVAAATDCPRLHLVLGTSNFTECRGGLASCDVYTAGRYWDVVAHDVMDYVTGKGYAKQVLGVWIGDDAETSWDPWPTTLRFLQGVRDQEHTYTTHAQMVNYGDANVGACSIVTGSCRAPWSAANVYDASWGLGWSLPVPETYNATTTRLWENVARTQGAQNPMVFAGVMTECGGPDPLPAGPCRPQGGGVTGKGACEWSPTVAATHMQSVAKESATAPSGSGTARLSVAPTLYATNMQWPPGSSGAKTNSAPCA